MPQEDLIDMFGVLQSANTLCSPYRTLPEKCPKGFPKPCSEFHLRDLQSLSVWKHIDTDQDGHNAQATITFVIP